MTTSFWDGVLHGYGRGGGEPVLCELRSLLARLCRRLKRQGRLLDFNFNINNIKIEETLYTGASSSAECTTMVVHSTRFNSIMLVFRKLEST
jgi:hypothetical protein